MEMVRGYDIDAIHFDFLRYPGIKFNDEKTYIRYGGRMPKDEWRRENINNFKNLTGAEGVQAYAEFSQDARRWLAEGKQDYVMTRLRGSWGL